MYVFPPITKSIGGKESIVLHGTWYSPGPTKVPPINFWSLFTLFLCDPLAAFCFIMNLVNISDETYSELLSNKNDYKVLPTQVI